MRTIALILACASFSGLSACATTSFAPPQVSLDYEMGFEDYGYHCGTRPRPAGGRPGDPFPQDVDGARRLIDNFVVTYRCAAHAAADGRQLFEVPSFLALTGTAAAAAFGAGADVAIAGGVANAFFGGANQYYSPKEKAAIYDRALDALLCIKTASVGITPFNLEEAAENQKLRARNFVTGEDTVTVAVDKQYYDMVAAALLSVERVAARRLSEVGASFDPAGVVSQIETLSETIRRKEREKATAVRMAGRNGLRSERLAELELSALQPEIQKCVVRAKL